MSLSTAKQQDLERLGGRLPFGQRLIGALLVLAGLGIFAIWGSYLVGGAFGQLPDGLFVYQEGNYPIFHLVAEGLMGLAALVAGVALWRGKRWGSGLGLLALGMLGYSAINSSGWPLHNDPPLLIPMAATLVLVIGVFPYLLRQVAARETESSIAEQESK